MSEQQTVELDSLIGEHVLDAVDMSTEKVKSWGDHFEDAEVIRFRLDGVVYTAVEDPDDGYRSSMSRLFVSPNDEMRNVFPPTRVLARKKDGGEYGGVNDTLQMIDLATGKVVLEVGTDNTDDYYPWFVAYFEPRHLAANTIIGEAPSRMETK
jgi:hypothetical protein